MDLDLDDASESSFVDHYIIQNAARCDHLSIAYVIGLEHHAVVDLVFAAEHHLHRRKHFLDPKFGQIPKTAVVDPEHQWFPVLNEASGRDDGAVSAEDDHQVHGRIKRVTILSLRKRPANSV